MFISLTPSPSLSLLQAHLLVYPTSTIRIIEVYENFFFHDSIEESIFSYAQAIVSWMTDIWLHVSDWMSWIFPDRCEFCIKTQKKRLIAFIQKFSHCFWELILIHYFDFDAMRFLRKTSASQSSPLLYSSIAFSNLVFFLVLLLVFMESPIR